MAEHNPNVVSASSTGPKLPDGVVDIESLESPDPVLGCRVFTHYNGPTDQLSGLCAGMSCSTRARVPIRRTSIPKKSS